MHNSIYPIYQGAAYNSTYPNMQWCLKQICKNKSSHAACMNILFPSECAVEFAIITNSTLCLILYPPAKSTQRQVSMCTKKHQFTAEVCAQTKSFLMCQLPRVYVYRKHWWHHSSMYRSRWLRKTFKALQTGSTLLLIFAFVTLSKHLYWNGGAAYLSKLLRQHNRTVLYKVTDRVLCICDWSTM